MPSHRTRRPRGGFGQDAHRPRGANASVCDEGIGRIQAGSPPVSLRSTPTPYRPAERVARRDGQRLGDGLRHIAAAPRRQARRDVGRVPVQIGDRGGRAAMDRA